MQELFSRKINLTLNYFFEFTNTKVRVHGDKTSSNLACDISNASRIDKTKIPYEGRSKKKFLKKENLLEEKKTLG